MTTLSYTVKTPTIAVIENIPTDVWQQIKSAFEYTKTEDKALYDKHCRDSRWKHNNKATWERKHLLLQSQLFTPIYSIVKNETTNEGVSVHCRPSSIVNFEVTNKKEATINWNSHVAITSLVLKPLEWTTPLKYQLYPYQKESVDSLLAIKHGNVELATGTGKSLILLSLIQRSGLQSVVIVPGKENFYSLLSLFNEHLDPNLIGMYGDSKKEVGKLITICIGKSLSLIKPDSPDYKYFRQTKMMITDESHTFAVDSMDNTCHKLLAHTPYRFFLSATQCRNDGEWNLLQSIIGKNVKTMKLAEAVRKNYINPHSYLIYKNVPSMPVTANDGDIDPLQIRRFHFLGNEHIADIIIKGCMEDVAIGKPSLILVDEVEQMGILVKAYKKYKNQSLDIPDTSDVSNYVLFCHSETNKKRLESLGLPSREKVMTIVERFNRGEKLILAGTSTIHTGCNIYPHHTTWCWIGGGAGNRIKTLQASVGRSVRFAKANPFFHELPESIQTKEEALICDFDVNERQLKSHLKKRLEYYAESQAKIVYKKI